MPVDPSPGRPRSAVVVDDDPAIREFVARLLRDAGFEVAVCADGRLQGVDLAAVDLLVTDLLMPDCDGFEVLGRVRKVAPHVRTVVITGTTDLHGLDTVRLARQMKADATLTKPFAVGELLETCERLVARPVATQPVEPR